MFSGHLLPLNTVVQVAVCGSKSNLFGGTIKGEHKKTKKITHWLTYGTRYCLGSKKVIRNSGQCGESKSEPFV